MTDPKHYRKHIVSVLVENHQGVLARIASLIAAKGYNIDSLSVAETLDPSVSRMTLSLHGDEWVIEQAVKQLHRLIDVVEEHLVTRAQIVQARLTIRRSDESVFRTGAVARKTHVAFAAVTWQ